MTGPPRPALGTPPRRRWRRWRRWWARPARRSSPAASGWSPACHVSRVTSHSVTSSSSPSLPLTATVTTHYTQESLLCAMYWLTLHSVECSGSTTTSGELNINDKTNNMTHRSLRLRGVTYYESSLITVDEYWPTFNFPRIQISWNIPFPEQRPALHTLYSAKLLGI